MSPESATRPDDSPPASSTESSSNESSLNQADPQSYFRSHDCCSDHECCRSLKTSEWAQATSCLVFVTVLPGRETVPSAAIHFSPDFHYSTESARAPPQA
jgi:hypothetical protein